MPSRRWDPSRLTSRAVQLTLLVAWVALVVWKILTFLSEPTTSTTVVEENFRRPYITLCPSPILSRKANQYLGSSLETTQHLESHTLLNVFKDSSHQLRDVLNIEDPQRDNFTFSYGKWTQKMNFAFGGLCSTLETDDNDVLFRVNRHLSTIKYHTLKSGLQGYCYCLKFLKFPPPYILYVHKLNDFWGGSDEYFTTPFDSEMVEFWIPFDTSQRELVINIERDVMPNLRRQPCEEDPNYSRSTCWRDCFLDWLNCSLLESGNTTGKPTCTAADYRWFKGAYNHFLYEQVYTTDKLGVRCSCRRPCTIDRYSLSVRSGLHTSDYHSITLQVNFIPITQTTKTYVSYDIIDLLADIGGFVGLLLGYSLFSVFEDLKSLATRLFRRRAVGATDDPPGDLNVLTFSIKIGSAQETVSRETDK